MTFKPLNWIFYKIILFSILLNISPAYAQIENFYISGAKEKEIDTLAQENLQKNIEMNEGLLEREIDPDTYIVGPNDKFTILINSSKTIQFNTKVAPDGKILIKGIGVVNAKGKTLQETIVLMKNTIQTKFSTDQIYVVLKDIRKFKVAVSGSVARPSTVASTAAERVNEVIDKAGGLKFDGSLRNIVLYRDDKNERIHVDLLRFYMLGDKNSNPVLLGGDQVIVLPSSESQTISINGEVNKPGEFEFVEGDSLSTLIKFGQGFLSSALLDSVEIARYEDDGETIRHLYIDLNQWKADLYSGTDLSKDFRLKAGDRVFVRRDPSWYENSYAVIEGEVKYPGKYAINDETDRVRDLIERAGGFLGQASVDHIEYIRQEELDIVDHEMLRLHKTLASEMSESEHRYFQARKNEKIGAMALDFNDIMLYPNSDENILLRSKDSIIVPKKKYHINIQGRVVNPGYVTFKKGMTYMDYINAAGGFSFRADETETMITKTKGEQFLAEDMNYVLEPGDVILVPPEKEISFTEIFTTTLTVVTQLVTVMGVVWSLTK